MVSVFGFPGGSPEEAHDARNSKEEGVCDVLQAVHHEFVLACPFAHSLLRQVHVVHEGCENDQCEDERKHFRLFLYDEKIGAQEVVGSVVEATRDHQNCEWRGIAKTRACPC